MDFYMNEIRLPPGIAKTKALKENLFCIIACCCTKLPLIIVGEPGSSKTLSFNLATANFKGADSKMFVFYKYSALTVCTLHALNSFI